MKKFKSKRIISYILAGTMMLSMCGMAGCGSKDKDTSDGTSIEIDATATDANASTDTENTINTDGATNTQYSVYSQPDPTSDEAKDEQARFATYLDESFVESVTTDTITLHYKLKDPEAMGIERPEVTYGDADMSDAALAKEKKECEEDLEELHSYNYDLLTSNQKFIYDILEDRIELNSKFYEYSDFYEPFAYTSGLHSNMPIALSEYNFYTKQDVDEYLQLLALTPEYFQAYLNFEKQKSARGYFMNDNAANEVIRQCNELIASKDNNLLVDTFNERIETVPGLTSEEIGAYKAANVEAVNNYIIPAYKNVIAVFKSLKGTCKNTMGLAHYENGKEYYAFMLKNKVGTDKTPEQVIELLDTQIDEKMKELQKLALGNYQAYSSYVDNYGSFYQDIDLEETIRYFEEVFDDKFPDIPDINFTATPVHESLKDVVSPAFCMVPPMDDYTNNTIHTNLSDSNGNNLWGTLCHEGVPGHMYQFVYYYSTNPEKIRGVLDFSGYEEGWATYVEHMSYQYYDGYDDPIYAELEELNGVLSLLVSARVEIGVNYEGWTLEETADYLNKAGFNGDAASEIYDYVVAEPVNYQMYVTGYLSFCELKDKASTALGDKFDEKTFHKVILDAGPCQFYLLEKLVDDYIESNK